MKKTPLKRVGSASWKTLERKADDLARKYCVRAGQCAANGHITGGKVHRCSDSLEWCHLKSRGVAALRHNPDNAVCLCNVHHRYFTMHPDEWYRFIESNYPGRWDDLKSHEEAMHTAFKVKFKEQVFKHWIEFYKAVD
jgi:hypothetical protein